VRLVIVAITLVATSFTILRMPLTTFEHRL